MLYDGTVSIQAAKITASVGLNSAKIKKPLKKAA
jgi:hypothetical protein